MAHSVMQSIKLTRAALTRLVMRQCGGLSRFPFTLIGAANTLPVSRRTSGSSAFTELVPYNSRED